MRMSRNGQMERSFFDQTGPTGKRGPPQKVDHFFRNFSGWTEPILEFWTEISGNFG